METPYSRDAELGGFVAEYRQESVFSFLTQMLFFGVLILLLLATGLPDSLSSWLCKGWFGILVMVGLGQSVVKLAKEWRKVILLYEDGLVEIRRGKTIRVRWRDCGYIVYHYGRHRRYAGTTIKLLNGYAISFDTQLTKGRDLAQHVQAFMRDEWLPVAVDTIEEGDTLDFGEIELNNVKLGSWTWERIEEVRIRREYIALKVTGKLLTALIYYRGIPNSLIFVELIKHIARMKFIPIT